MGNCCAADSTNSTTEPVQEKKKGGKKAAPKANIAPEDDAPAPVPVKEVLKDLDPPKSWGLKDEIQQFEQALPFNRIDINELIKRADAAAEKQNEATGNAGSFTLATLAEQLDSPAWAALKDPNSTLAKLLLHDRFHEEDDTPKDQVDIDIFKCFGLFHCQGKPEAKAICLYNILQDGGLEAHEQISAGDKDFKPNFIRLAALASKNIFKLANELGSDCPDYYTDEDCETMLNEDNVEVLVEDHFLEGVFGAKSRLENDQWLKQVQSKECKWIFTVDEFREKILEVAGIEKKH